MDTEKLFMKMKNPDDSAYKYKAAFFTVMTGFIKYAVFPLVLCAVMAGGVFTASDAVMQIYPTSMEYSGVKTSRRAEKSMMPVISVNIEYEPFYGDTATAVTEKPGDDDDNELKNEKLLKTLYNYDRSKVPEGMTAVVPISLYRNAGEGKVYISDKDGKRAVDSDEYLSQPLAVSYEPSDEYQVLIIHTHGTEAYLPDGALYVEKDTLTRSDNKDESVVCLGDIFEKYLNEAGLKTLHCEVAIDAASYSKSYNNAAKLIQGFLKEYPSIKYMFDIHRDAVLTSDGDIGRPVTAVNGEAAAQVMFVVGSDQLVKSNVNWRDNLTLAVKLQTALDSEYTGLVRPINIKQGAYNQMYTPLSVLIEIGCDGNSIEEAKRSAEVVAKQLAKTLTQG